MKYSPRRMSKSRLAPGAVTEATRVTLLSSGCLPIIDSFLDYIAVCDLIAILDSVVFNGAKYVKGFNEDQVIVQARLGKDSE